MRLGIAFPILLLLTGCFGGSKTKIVMVQPGSVVEVVDEKVKVQVKYKDDDGKDKTAVSEANLAGAVAMPLSIYRKMRAAYIELYAFLNGKINEKELRKRLTEQRKERGAEEDKK